MPIPTVVGDQGLLPAGRHPATLEEIEAYFVHAAPFSGERALLFQCLQTWMALIQKIIPEARFWIDGGFVTHKQWAAPSDVDVMILCKQAALDSLSLQDEIQLSSLMTIAATGSSPRWQPMGGLVDAFMTVRGPQGNAPYWHNLWGQVKGEDGARVITLTKGFLEVTT